jgi:hypothetical protein
VVNERQVFTGRHSPDLTATDSAFATERFALGESAVVLVTPGPRVIGALATYTGSVAGNSNRPSINLLEPRPSNILEWKPINIAVLMALLMSTP